MFVVTMAAAIEAAHTLAQMDALSRDVWRAHSSGAVDDVGAQRLAELLHARRMAVRETIQPVGIPLGRATLFPPRRPQVSPDRAASRDRRRLLASSGPMPPQLAARFTTGQLAVLKIIGDEVAANGVCGLCVDAIAARAGVCRRLAQVAVRMAEGDGLITVQERRRQGRKNDTNVIRVLSREWLAWIARRRSRAAAPPQAKTIGCRPLHRTDRGVNSGDETAKQSCRNAAGRQRLLSRERASRRRSG